VLILAQQAADRTVEEARTESDRTVEEARTEAVRLLDEANAEAERTLSEARTEADSFEAEREQRREAATTEMAELSLLVARVRNQLALLATTVADKLDEMDSTIGATDLVAATEGVGDLDADSGEDTGLDLDLVAEPSLELTGDDATADLIDETGAEVEESAELDLDTIQSEDVVEDQDINLESEPEPASGLEAERDSGDQVDDDEAPDSAAGDEGDEGDEDPETSG
jgi:vacuolar-type H+-ATPase subunit H